MRNYICWNPRTVYEVIKIDAEAVGDTVFQAVHSPQPMLMSTTSVDNLTRCTDQDFLKAFTNPDRPETFSLLLGDSGMGKTHFIHWLRLNVPVNENTRVVSIPKVGTSLRKIVEEIINQLPETMRIQYLNKLTAVRGETHTREQLQEKLLDSLAQAVSVEADRGSIQDMERREILKWLAPLFRDPHVRSQWFLAGERESIIKELTRHVYEPNAIYGRLERDYRFEAADFHIKGVPVQDVSKEARTIINCFHSDPRYYEIAAELANQCLDAAIGEALSFSSEDLVALVGEVRKHLHAQGLSLILYIEDLSRMQGVDKALLDALTTPSEQGGQKLCTIRWIAAMTTGYFARLEATIVTRINLLGKMEAVQDFWSGQQAQGELAAFMGRYLNAVRLGMNGLHEWDATRDVSNACDACEHKERCHDAFGTGGGFGLYPFTAEGLLNMAERSAPQNEFWFKPRRLLKSIMTPILSTYGRDIVEGRFPDPAMIEEMGGEKLDALEKVFLHQNSGVDAGRHLALQELWQPSGKIISFHEDILRAFNLRPLQKRVHTTPAPVPPLPSKGAAGGAELRVEIPRSSGTGVAPPAPFHAELRDPILEQIRDWGNRKPITDQVAQRLRPLVFEAVTNFIDWDLAGVSRTTYVGANSPFRSTSIVFKGQVTKSSAPLQITLPLQEDDLSYARAATALQGLYLFADNGHWNFNDGYNYCAHAQNCLEEWAEDALTKIRNSAPNDEKWNALDAATELLAIGAALSGNIGVDSTRDDIWSAIWGNPLLAASDRLLSDELGNIATDIFKKWGKLQEHVNARSFGTKGSNKSNYLNPFDRERALNRLMRNHWALSMVPNPDAPMYKDFLEIAKLYQKVAQSFRPALVAEATQYQDWLEKMDESFGAGMTSKSDIVAVFSELQKALNNGGFLKQVSDRFQSQMDEFASSYYNDARKRAGLVKATESGKLTPHLFAKKNVATTMNKAKSLADAAERFLTSVQGFYQERLDEIETAADGGLQACWGGMSETLSTLETTLQQLAGDEGIGG